MNLPSVICCTTLLIGGLLPSATLHAQEPPAFEVASVKRIPPGHSGLTDISPYGGGRFTARSASLQFLIGLAFDVSEDRLQGAPNWLGWEYYDIDAKPEAGVRLTYEELKPRLQQLLAQRLKLSTHRQMKDFECYALMVAKGGPKLKEAAPENSSGGYILPGGLQFPSLSMEGLASVLARPLGRPVVDKTGIEGNHKIQLSYAQDTEVNPTRPSIFTAVQEQLGLKLEKQAVPVEMLVIEHVEREPTPI